MYAKVLRPVDAMHMGVRLERCGGRRESSIPDRSFWVGQNVWTPNLVEVIT